MYNTNGTTRVVPYNPKLLLFLHAHLNAEIAATVNCITYVYKYPKGSYRIRCSISAENIDETV